MSKERKYYIVEESVLPKVFIKVAETKLLLQTGAASTINEATKLTGISRSAFYKYKDYVDVFRNMSTGRMVTFQFLLQDREGCLADLLELYTTYSINIQTINSIIPTNGCALVTISAETHNLSISLEELLHLFSQIPGVIKAQIIGGG
ncbi:MAG: ACT domain-containing protein [Oscillospiraceae bacterium]|nr:ACT domain-containing protein [Oscillospiraceae bacterium]